MLFARVGPRIAVMKINQQPQAGGLDPLGHGQSVEQIAIPVRRVRPIVRSRLGWIHEHSQANIVESVILEDLQYVFFNAAVGEFHASILRRLNRGYVRANDERRPFLGETDPADRRLYFGHALPRTERSWPTRAAEQPAPECTLR